MKGLYYVRDTLSTHIMIPKFNMTANITKCFILFFFLVAVADNLHTLQSTHNFNISILSWGLKCKNHAQEFLVMAHILTAQVKRKMITERFSKEKPKPIEKPSKLSLNTNTNV